ncbi:hypothetical protein [Rickettsiella endosymbiont of Aleochara curtula]|uniref:hypothetical protein n=1 Tax=Rickettsiella endosymbiont of Aleochara curtula TaxID=3077936 RepID=UPI00313D19E1
MPAMKFSYQAEMFDSVPMQNLLSYFEQEKIIDTALREIDGKISQDPKAKRYLNIVNKREQLIRELDENHRRRDTEIKKILANAGLKKQLRDFPQRTLQLINTQKELAAELSEEEMSEEEAEGLKIRINYELGLLCSEALRELYTQDVQAILANGISEPVVPYLKKLSQLDHKICEKVGVEVDNYSIQRAEELIAQHSLVANNTAKKNIIINADSLGLRGEVSEDEPMTPLYAADSAELVYDLVLNGADPIAESKGLSITPLAHQFALRYEIEQTLNGINIGIANAQAELKNSPTKQIKAKLKDHTKELNAEAKLLDLKLKNKEDLINAHIRAIVLRKPDADAEHYPDISYSVKFQQTWNDCKQEIKIMQQTKFTENCTSHDFLSKDLQTLPALSKKTLKSIAAQFPHFGPLLRMQNDIANNYNLVRGSVKNIKILENNNEEKLMPNISNTKPDFKAELEHKPAQRAQTQREQETAAYEELVNKPSSSSSADLVIYAKLDLLPPQNVFLGKLAEERTDYAEVLTYSKFIKQTNQLQEKLQCSFEEIEKLETKIKNCFKDCFKDGDLKVLTEIKNELISANQEKHNLQSELKEIRQSLRGEFDRNFKHEHEKATILEEQIKNAHGSQYDQLTAELFRTRDAYVCLIQKNREFEASIANSSKDLKSESKARVVLLDKQELSLQVEIEKSLLEKKAIIEKNLENTLAVSQEETAELKTYQQQYSNTLEKLVTCKERICELNYILPNSPKVIDQQASSQVPGDRLTIFEENPFYNAAQSNAEQVSTNVSIREETSEAPKVRRDLKPAPVVDRKLKPKPSRLAGSHLFSLPKNIDTEEEQDLEVNNQVTRACAS